jgi:hypothetical protein
LAKAYWVNKFRSVSDPQKLAGYIESWCRYARAWVSVKVTWSLSATTAERDALGQMLDTC